MPRLLMLLFCVLLAVLSGCDQSKKTETKKKTVQIITVKLETPVTKLYFKGNLQPISHIPVLSPVDGTVAKLDFTYGERVEKGKQLAVLTSTALADNYRKALTDYLQKKNTYTIQMQSFAGSEALYRAGVISQDEYNNTKSEYETNVLNYFQSKFELEKILARANLDPSDVEKLTIADTEMVNKLLQRHFSNIVVSSPGKGIALFPTESSGGGGGGGGSGDGSSDGSSGAGDKSGKLYVGSQLKRGQLMLTIGDLSGYSTTINVSEININRINTGNPVTVTGDAFPGITLDGYISTVSSQANPGSGDQGSVSLFACTVIIPNVSEKLRDVIRVGMSANIEIDLKDKPRIQLPIKAVTIIQEKSYVTKVEKDGTYTKVPVVTGETTETQVIILKGLEPGDKVVVHD